MSRLFKRGKSRTRLSGIPSDKAPLDVLGDDSENDAAVGNQALKPKKSFSSKLLGKIREETREVTVQVKSLEKGQQGGSDTPTKKTRKLEKQVQWLEEERLRLLQLSRSGSSRKLRTASESEDSGKSGWSTSRKEFTVVVALCKLKLTQNSDLASADAKTKFAAIAGIALAERENAPGLVVEEFWRDAEGNPGPVEESGHVGVDDALTSVGERSVTGLVDLESALEELPGEETEVRLVFSREYVVQAVAGKQMSVPELLAHVKELERELKFARDEYARLDIGVVESLQVALEDSQAELRAAELRIVDLEEQLRQANEQLLQRKEQVEDLEEKLEMFERQHAELQSQLADAKTQREEIHASLAASREESSMALAASAGALLAREEELLAVIESKNREIEEICTYTRQLQNNLIDIKGQIRVFVRVRPAPGQVFTHAKGADASTSEAILAAAQAAAKVDENEVLHAQDRSRQISLSDMGRADVPEKKWEFDNVFPKHAGQREVYREVEPIIHSVVDGTNACVFAYGQTGSGKTYTMDGPDADRGVYYRAAETLFETIEKRKAQNRKENEQLEFNVKVSVIEIYQERVRDLLNPALEEYQTAQDKEQQQRGASASKKSSSTDAAVSPAKSVASSVSSSSSTTSTSLKDLPSSIEPYSLEIHSNPETGYVFVKGAQEIPVHNAGELHSLIEKGKRQRVVGVTNANAHSSRSHMILLIQVTQSKLDSRGKTKRPPFTSKLQLIDLAGSEKASDVPCGQRLKETGSINRSLFALGDVMHALQKNETNRRHIPFRNSKLTWLLSDSLGGRARTLMMIQVSPLREHMAESIRTLDFGQRVGKICLQRASTKGLPDQVVRLKKENVELNNMLAKLRNSLLTSRQQCDEAVKNKDAAETGARNLQTKMEEQTIAWHAREKELLDQISTLKKDVSKSLRKEKEDFMKKKEVDIKRLASELLFAQQDLATTKSRNSDIRRENKELSMRIMILEKQAENREKEKDKDESRESGVFLSRSASSRRATFARQKSARMSSVDEDTHQTPTRFAQSSRRLTVSSSNQSFKLGRSASTLPRGFSLAQAEEALRKEG